MLKIVILFSLFFYSTFFFAQTGTLKGKVVETGTRSPLIGASVSCGTLGTTTDLDGNYSLSLPVGTYKLEISYTGYEPHNKDLVVKSGEVIVLDVALNSEPRLLSMPTITGSKFEKPLSVQTVSLDIIRPKLIENYNATSIEKVIDKVPGVEVVDGQASIRGGAGFSGNTGSRVLMLMDDMPALQADFGLVQWGDLPVELIERMEVLKGASSALYGSSALNGIVNVRSIYPTAVPQTKFATWGTAYMPPAMIDTCRGRGCLVDNSLDYTPFDMGMQFSHSQKIKRLGLVLGGYYQNSKGFVEGSYARRGRLSAKFSWAFSDKLQIGVNVYGNINSQAFPFFWKNAFGGMYRQELLDPFTRDTVTSYIEGVGTRVNIDPYLNFYTPKGHRHRLNMRLMLTNNDNNNNQSNSSKLYYSEYQHQRHYSNFDLSVGVAGYYMSSKAEVLDNKTYQQYNVAPYFQVETKVLKKLNISVGARFEINGQIAGDSLVSQWVIESGNANIRNIRNPFQNVTDARPVYRVGANYELSKNTFLRASWGTGYRFPTLGEKYLKTTAGIVNVLPNPYLLPETGWSAELGVKQGLKLSNWMGFIDVAGFVNEYSNMIEIVAGGKDFQGVYDFVLQQAVNVGDTRITGAEVSLTGQGKIGQIPLTIQAGGTLIDPQYRDFGTQQQSYGTSTENVLKYRSKLTAKFDIETGYKNFSIGFTGVFRSKVESVDPFFLSPFLLFNPYSWARDIKPFWEQYNRDFWVFDLRSSYQINANMKVSLLAKNLFNTIYVLRPARAEAPLNITMRLDYKI